MSTTTWFEGDEHFKWEPTVCSIFEDEAVAELLTTGKLSELAVLTLYLM